MPSKSAVGCLVAVTISSGKLGGVGLTKLKVGINGFGRIGRLVKHSRNNTLLKLVFMRLEPTTHAH